MLHLLLAGVGHDGGVRDAGGVHARAQHQRVSEPATQRGDSCARTAPGGDTAGPGTVPRPSEGALTWQKQTESEDMESMQVLPGWRGAGSAHHPLWHGWSSRGHLDGKDLVPQ